MANNKAISENYTERCKDIETRLYKYLVSNDIYADDVSIDEYNNSIEIKIWLSGDWKHQHLFTEHLVETFCEENHLVIINQDEDITSDTDDDDYESVHTWTVKDDSVKESISMDSAVSVYPPEGEDDPEESAWKDIYNKLKDILGYKIEDCSSYGADAPKDKWYISDIEYESDDERYYSSWWSTHKFKYESTLDIPDPYEDEEGYNEYLKNIKFNEIYNFLDDNCSEIDSDWDDGEIIEATIKGESSYDESIKYNKTKEDIKEEIVAETYSEEELDKLIGKIYNIQQIDSIYRREKYGESRLFAKTVCTKCGRTKRVFLSNLINDPEKYGSCICSDTNIDAKIDRATDLYTNKEKLSSNTSGYTGVSFVKNYGGEPYNMWRAYIDVDGARIYLGDFKLKKDAIQARKEAGEKGVKWYRANKNKLQKTLRKKTKKFASSKYRDAIHKTINVKPED